MIFGILRDLSMTNLLFIYGNLKDPCLVFDFQDQILDQMDFNFSLLN